MKRNEIKDIVYECAKHRFYNKEEFDNLKMPKPNDGEDLQIYNELKFDSLDIITFIMEVESECHITLPDKLFNDHITLGILIDYIYKNGNKQ